MLRSRFRGRDRPAQRPGTETAYLDGEAVVFDVASSTVQQLSSSAAAVWLLCDGATTVDGMVAELSEIFGEPTERVRRDVVLALGRLWEEGLLEGSPQRRSAPAPALPRGGGPRDVPQPPDP